MKVITVRQIMRWDPCEDYDTARVKRLIGDGKTPLEIVSLRNIPRADKLWALCRKSLLGAKYYNKILEKAKSLCDDQYYIEGSNLFDIIMLSNYTNTDFDSTAAIDKYFLGVLKRVYKKIEEEQ